MTAFTSTLRTSLRSLLRSPGFAAAVVASFTLGVGLNTAIFSAAWSMLLAPLPLDQPDRLLALWETHGDERRRPIAPANFLDWRRELKSISGAASYFEESQVMEVGGEPRRVSVAQVSSQFFEVLGAHAARGRLFTSGETRPLAVVSEPFWEEQLAGGAVEGRTLVLDGVAHDVVGVVPASFDLPRNTRIWTVAAGDVARLTIARELDPMTLRDARYLGAYARLAPGATIEQADAELAALGERLAREYPDDNRDCGARAVALGADLGTEVTKPVALLGAGALALLLVTCANVAGLAAARALGRRRELAVRAALGAGRSGLVSQGLGEMAILAVVGGGLGLALAAYGAPLLVAALPGAEVAGRPIGVPSTVALFATLAVAISAALAAWAPTWSALRVEAAAALAGARGTVGPVSGRLRSALVVGQVALALVLVSSSLLVARTLAKIVAVDPGFDAEGVVTLRIWAPTRDDVPLAARNALLERAVDAAGEAPGVESAGAILKLPLTGANISAGGRVDGRDDAPGTNPNLSWRLVSDGYFDTLGIRLVAGRGFEAADRGGVPVALVNQTLARQLWPGEDPLGKRLATGLDLASDAGWLTVVGVVADTPQAALTTPANPELYRPLSQPNRFGGGSVVLAVRTAPGFSIAALREQLRAVSPELVLDPERPLSEVVRVSIANQRLLGTLLGLFAALALLLAAIGLYGVLALAVAERRRELGVRAAVGATAAGLRALVLRRGAAQALAGIALGLPFTLGAGRLLASWLYEVSPTDPWSLGGALAALATAALLASWLPARRAARVDPMTALKDA